LDQSAWASQNEVEFARVKKDLKGKAVIILTHEKRAATKVRDLTAKNIGNSVGIVVNPEVVVAPRMVGPSSEIPIEADFSSAEASAAAFNRRAGKR
jgi:preprotein translocase subunit SecD